MRISASPSSNVLAFAVSSLICAIHTIAAAIRSSTARSSAPIGRFVASLTASISAAVCAAIAARSCGRPPGSAASRGSVSATPPGGSASIQTCGS